MTTGFVRGSMIWEKMHRWLAPSTLAASIRSSGSQLAQQEDGGDPEPSRKDDGSMGIVQPQGPEQHELRDERDLARYHDRGKKQNENDVPAFEIYFGKAVGRKRGYD